ncbi:type II secretion system minor pseudopilin GspJ [Sphingomonas sp. TREG-RG-20F-R18-01]|uniref:type II secretion system minor pseudopilin GspJ n=1 Tax=Sphingomonas sp. TREG-RG-20F-R18-01 TaxID=2914982 RepID=UPI0024121A1C|nr:type II secretion system minor pseudopilin GspJ [Sphingomonas sp. TREG-RG-20F-R18-01]
MAGDARSYLDLSHWAPAFARHLRKSPDPATVTPAKAGAVWLSGRGETAGCGITGFAPLHGGPGLRRGDGKGQQRDFRRGLAFAGEREGDRGARTSAESGFTLIEVMISLLIFGLLSAAGVALLSFSVRAQGATAAKLDDVSAMNQLESIMTADFAQALDRPVRDENGNGTPAFVGGSGPTAVPMLRFVRGGWSNLDGMPRADVQKVEYAVIDGALARVAYPMLDGAQPLPATPIVPRVKQVALRYRIKGAWSDRWTGAPQTPLPDAVELRILRTGGIETRELFLVGTGYGKRADARTS